MPKIFVNFRRDDAPTEARRVRDGLAAYFSRSDVFMDTDGLLAGPRFEQDLANTLDGADVVVAVIGPRWMELLRGHAAGGKRDFERDQLAAALKRGIPVVPVRVGADGQVPVAFRAEDLPVDIRPLAKRVGRDVSGDRFGSELTRLAEQIARVRSDAEARFTAGNSTGRLWLWSAACAASAVLVGNLSFYLSGAAALLSSSPPAVQSRPMVSNLFSSAEERIRRAIAAAEAKGRRGAEARRCQSALISAAATGTIVFHTASAELDQRSHETLDNLAQIVRSCPDFVVEVEGHTDSAGDPAANQRLSERRAGAVRDYLVRVGVPESAMAAYGYGETRPVAPNDTAANMARNRRIEFNVTVR